MESVADWSGLLGELLELIATRLVIKEDFTAFRGVCTSWRGAVAEDKYLNGSKLPMLLLPQKNGECELYSLSERRIYAKIALPQTIGKKCLDVGFGWILTLADEDAAGMFKPLSKAKPILIPFADLAIKQVVLSDDPSSTTADLAVVSEIFVSIHINDGHWDWERSGVNPFIGKCTSCCCYDNMIFTLEPSSGKIWVWDPCGLRFIDSMRVDNNLLSVTSNYLVPSTFGGLLLISRHENSRSFSVIWIYVALKQWKVTNDLRGDTIFLSDNLPICVAAADYPGVLKPNCIYFANGKDIGIYDVQEKSFVEEFGFESSYSLSSPPLWIFPSV